MAEDAGGAGRETSGFDLIAFARYLEGHGYSIDAERCAAAQAILAWLALEFGLSGNAARLSGFLAPLFARTPEEQHAFPMHLARWLGDTEGVATAPIQETATLARPPLTARKRRGVWVGVACILAIAATAGAWWWGRAIGLTGRVVDADGDPIAGARVELPHAVSQTDNGGAFSLTYRRWQLPATLRVLADGFEVYRSQLKASNPGPLAITLQPSGAGTSPSLPPPPRPADSFAPDLVVSSHMVYGDDPQRRGWLSYYNPWALLLFSIGVLSAACAWLIWRVLPGFVSRMRYRGRPKITRMRVAKSGESMFAHPQFRRVVQQLSRHRLEPSRELDLAATVRKTIYNGARFSPVFGNWRVRPEYLALIERVGEGDERARLSTELLAEWERSGVFVRRQYFYGDPTVSRSEIAPGKTYTLSELASRFSDHILLVFSEAKGFLHPYTGQLAQWVSQMSEWPRRVVFLPEPVDASRAGALNAAGFDVCPDTGEGIAQFADVVLAGMVSEVRGGAGEDEFPEMLGDAPSQWLDRRPPDRGQLALLSIQLRAYLSEDGYLLLAACAAYPELAWNITLFLMEQLIPPTRREAVAGRLLRLPWFRHGYMPDWLRERLLDHLSPEDDRCVRDAIERLLYSYLAKPAHGFLLEVASQRLRAWQRSLLRQIVFSTPSAENLRERVFLRFLTGIHGRLNMRLPRAVQGWLRRYALRPEHRGWAAAGITAAIAAAAIAVAALVPAFQELEPLNAGVWAHNPPAGWDRTFSRVPTLFGTGYSVPQLAYLYNFPSEYDGEGQTIGFIELGGGYRDADLDAYFSRLKLPRPQVSSVSVGGVKNSPGDINGGAGEVMMDLEVAGAVAPKAHLVVYFAPANLEQGISDAVKAALADKQNRPGVIMIGWGGPEANYKPASVVRMEAILEQASSQRVTVVAAGGDSGAADGRTQSGQSSPKIAVEYPASSPWVLGVGGTELTSASGAIQSEVVWNGGNNMGATGGGISTLFPVPSWQSAIKLPVTPDGKKGRGSPDVAANASPLMGYQTLMQDQLQVMGGNGAAAALWAGLIAILNQGLGRNIGFLNPVLYSKIGPAGVLRAITRGNNDFGGVKGYSAGPGWNACTGWGTPDGRKLLAALSTLGR